MKRLKRIQISFHEEPGWTVPVQKGQLRLLLHKEPLRIRNPDLPRLSRYRSAASRPIPWFSGLHLCKNRLILRWNALYIAPRKT